jgi:hypothetical protein
VTPSVARQVDSFDRVVTQLPNVAVLEPLGVRAGGVMELFEAQRGEVASRLSLEAVDLHQAVEALGREQVIVMDVNSGVGEQTVAWDMVLVTMTVEYGVDR